MEALFPGASEYYPRNDRLHANERVRGCHATVGIGHVPLEFLLMPTRIRYSRMQIFASAVSTSTRASRVSGFYDRYLQEVGAWTEAGNAFLKSEIIIEGNDFDPEIDEENVQVQAIRARIHLKSEKKKAMNFMTKLFVLCLEWVNEPANSCVNMSLIKIALWRRTVLIVWRELYI